MINLVIAANIAFDFLKNSAPVDTGNLKENAIRIVQSGENEYQIIVDSKIAPYAVYTNEKWVAARWNGKQNPNEKWIDAAVDNIAQMIASYFGGSLRYSSANLQDRWNNQDYWDDVQRGVITRSDNITSII